MNCELTEEQTMLRDAVAKLAAEFDDDYWAERDSTETFPHEFYNAFAEAGWLGIAIPEEYGGSGLGILEASILLEEIAASGAGMNVCSTLHFTIFGLNTIVKHANESLRQEILTRAVDGSLHVCFGITEPNAGTDTTRISTFARRDGEGYRINGRKVWITKAGNSQKMVLIARTSARDEGNRPTDGMSLFLIDIEN